MLKKPTKLSTLCNKIIISIHPPTLLPTRIITLVRTRLMATILDRLVS